MSLLERQRRLIDIGTEIKQIRAEAKNKTDSLAKEAYEIRRLVSLEDVGIDTAKIALARDVIVVRGRFSDAGDDRQSVIDDAVRQITTGKAESPYSDLGLRNLGTKSYSPWYGQRCDCEPGTGPRHGRIIFSVGLTREARQAGGIAALTTEQREAALYLLTRLEMVQKIEQEEAA